MTPAKIPVGRTPICDPSYLRRINPVWVCEPVPFRFWEDVDNRRDFLLWLAHKQRFRWMTDWYRLNFRLLAKKSSKGRFFTIGKDCRLLH